MTAVAIWLVIFAVIAAFAIGPERLRSLWRRTLQAASDRLVAYRQRRREKWIQPRRYVKGLHGERFRKPKRLR